MPDDARSRRTTDRLRGRQSELLKKAGSLAESGGYEAAVSVIHEAMTLCPNDPKPNLELARIYRAQGRIGDSIESVRRALDLDPDDSTVQEQYLRALVDSGRYDEALAVCGELLKRSPKSVLARDVQGLVYLQQGRLGEALKVTEELVYLDPTDPFHHYKKALLFQQLGEIGAATSTYARVVDMDPEGELAEEAKRALAALDGFQIQQIASIASEDQAFRVKLSLDPEVAIAEKGFVLSRGGLIALRQIDIPMPPRGKTYYH
jgi:tetratricopeptide (TPR) repeat protein